MVTTTVTGTISTTTYGSDVAYPQKFVATVNHGPNFKETCMSCTSGREYVKTAIQFINNTRVVCNRDIDQMTGDTISVTLKKDGQPPARHTFSSKQPKVVVIDVEPTTENLVAWYCRTFKEQLVMAHVHDITFQVGTETATVQLGY